MKRSMRLFGVLFALLMVTQGCASKSNEEASRTTGKYGSAVNLDVGKTKKLKQAGAEAKAEGVPGHPAPVQQSGSTGGGGGFQPDISRKATDAGSAGVNAFFYLNKQVPRLVIEVDAVAGHEPSPSVISLVRQRLIGFVDKPGGVQILPTQKIPGRETWSESDAMEAEAKYRDTHNTKDQASIYILYANGRPARSGPIGIAYSGASVIIYIQEIRGIATPVVGAEGIEKATVIHEVGHLFALVNQTYKSPRDHEDPEHKGHSKNQQSVMYYAVDSIGVVGLLGGRTEPPNSFDKDDLADLADLKSGKLR